MSRISFTNVSKSYSLKPGQKWLRSFVQDLTRREGKSLKALHDVSFSVAEGQSVALVGRNGAGKSTILSLIAGLMVPTAGSVSVEGRVSALLDLGAGFHGDLTGRENLHVTAALMGLSRRDVRRQTDEIIEFSGLGEFIDQPIRTYSSGMTMRLAFSVAVAVDPDILLIDEVLGVGDSSFQAKCSERISDLKNRGKILLCVSHSMAIEQLCESAIWVEQGVIRKTGATAEVMAAYSSSLSENVNIHQEVPAAPQPGLVKKAVKRAADRYAATGS